MNKFPAWYFAYDGCSIGVCRLPNWPWRVGISISGACACVQWQSCVWLFVTPRTAAHQAVVFLPGKSTMEWVAISFSRGSSQCRDQTPISRTGREVLDHWATREAQVLVAEGARSIWPLCLVSGAELQKPSEFSVLKKSLLLFIMSSFQPHLSSS